MALLGVAARVSAQEVAGGLEGRVLTPDDAPAGSVRVMASGSSLQLPREMETDSRGYFRFRALPVGNYQVRLALVGYRPVVLDGVTVRLGRTTFVGEIRLVPQVVELGEIVVRADRPLVDMGSAATVTNLPAEQFRDLPTTRDFRSIVTLAPQADRSGLPGDEANIAGGTGPENAYYLDGVNITDPYTASTSADLPYNFVRELEVKQGGYEAEYGRATGGIVNVITHSGSNRFAGQVFGSFTGDALTSEPRFQFEGTKEPGFSEYDVGGSLGGPVVRDRLWFFAAYDPSFRRQRVDVPGVALPDDWSVKHLFATKLTWQAGPHTDVVVTAHGDPSRHYISNPDDAGDSLVNAEAITGLSHQGGLVLSALVRQRLGAGTQAELSLARLTRHDDIEAASELGRTEPHFVDERDFSRPVVSGGYGFSAREHGSRTAARANISAVLGRHAIKVGIEYEDNRTERDYDQSAQPGSPGGIIKRVDDTTYFWARTGFHASVHNRVPTLYAQDSWRLNERLTVNAGMRWDGQYFIGPNGDVAQSFTDQWQPRIGLIYRFGALGSQKVFGSYARFYEEVPLRLAQLLYDPNVVIRLYYDHDPRVDPSGADTTISPFSSSGVAEPPHDLEGQSLDEFTLGYERAIGGELRVGVRGVYRALRWALEDAFNPATGGVEFGNPGRGNLSLTPRARRKYTALVLTVEKPVGARFDFLASYVLSRSWGNYVGLYDFLLNGAGPNLSQQLDNPTLFPNSTGLLPNDRTHVFKFSGAYRFPFGLTFGTSVAWMSGTPRVELGATSLFELVFLRPRGSGRRNDAVFDASLRLAYKLHSQRATGLRPKLYLDLFQLGNRRTPLFRWEGRYLYVDAPGGPIPDPNYNRPLVFQPPMSARLGLSVDFGTLD